MEKNYSIRSLNVYVMNLLAPKAYKKKVQNPLDSIKDNMFLCIYFHGFNHVWFISFYLYLWTSGL